MSENEKDKRRVPSFDEIPSVIPFIRQWEILVGGASSLPPQDRPLHGSLEEAIGAMSEEKRELFNQKLVEISGRHGSGGP